MTQPPERLGTIIKIIGNHPGITMTGVLTELRRLGITITERTLAKDILSLKQDFFLLPNKERLRHGYALEGICTLSDSELALVLDAMYVFGDRLSDPDALTMTGRLKDLIKEGGKGEVLKRYRSRTVGLRNIYARTKNNQAVERALLEAITQHLPVKMTYLTPRIGKPEQAGGYPLVLVFHERGWYCIVRDAGKNVYQPRRLDRIRECTILSKGKPNQTRVEDLKEAQFLLSCGWGMSFPRSMDELKKSESQPEIVVRFDRTVAPFLLESVERHPRGKVEKLKDGSGDVQFRIRLSNPVEFQYWVRSFGSKAWFVAPTALVESEKSEIRRMSQRYQIR